jgi:hypothetical protein
MPSLDALSLPGFDYATGMLMLPWWVAAAVAAILVVVILVAMVRGGAAGVVTGLGAIAGLALVVALAGVWITRSVDLEHADDRRALAVRAQELTARAVMPGSALGCLDAVAGETVESACEKALFETPQAVSAAAAYVAARIALLSDGVDYSVRTNASYEAILPGVRRALEADRYGFVAHVLAANYGCSADQCGALVLFRDPARITANLKDKTYDGYVSRHAASGVASVAASTPANTPASTPERRPRPSATGGPSPVPPGFEVPSASSIPPVSIMTPETGTAPPSSGAAPTETAAAPPSPPSPPRRPASRPARPAQAAPVQLVPPAPTLPPPPGNTGSAPRPQ